MVCRVLGFDYNILQRPFGNVMDIVIIPPVLDIFRIDNFLDHHLFSRLAHSYGQNNIKPIWQMEAMVYDIFF